MGTLAERQEPRFNTATSVVMAVEGRAALQQLWTANISKGGLFVVTRTPPPLQTRVSVTLETPDGSLSLQAEVVHVVPPQADAPTAVAGAGLQFLAVDEAQRQAIQRYLDGVVNQLQSTPAAGGGSMQLTALMGTVRAVLAGVDAGDAYAALQLPATARSAELEARLKAVTQQLKTVPPEASVAQRARIQSAERALEKLAPKLATLGRGPPPSAVSEGPVGSLNAEKRARLDVMAAAKAHSDLGKQHMERQEFAAAEKEFRAAAEADPNVVAYQLSLAWSMAVGTQRPVDARVKLAMEVLQPLMKRFRQVDIPYTAGMVMNLAEKHQEAERFFKVALELDKEHVASQRMLRLLEARKAKEAAGGGGKSLLDLFKRS